MGLFENRKSSGMVLTGVVLSSSVMSATSQGVVGAEKALSAQENLTDTVVRLAKDNSGKIIVSLVVTGLLVYFLYKMRSFGKRGEITENAKKTEKGNLKQSQKNVIIVDNLGGENDDNKKLDVEKRKINKDAEKLLKELEALANKLGFGDIAFLDEKSLDRFESYKKNNPGAYLVMIVVDFIKEAGIYDLYKYIYVINVVAKYEGLDLNIYDPGFCSFDLYDDNYKNTLKKFGDGKIKMDSEIRKELVSLLNKINVYLSDSYKNLKEYYNEVSRKTGKEGSTFGRKPGEVINAEDVVDVVPKIVDRTNKLVKFFENASKEEEKIIVLEDSEKK